MSRILTKSLIAAAVASVSLTAATPALARHYYNDGYSRNYDDGYYRNNGRYNDGYNARDYDRRDYRGYRNYRGNRCSSGTTGTILGAIAGGLLGREVVGRRGDRTAGTIVGAGAGALAGRAIDRNGRC